MQYREGVKKMPKYVYRNGRKFRVLKHNPIDNEVQVEEKIEFYNAPYIRKIKCWWDLDDCELLEET